MAVTLIDKYSRGHLLAAGNDTVYYEDLDMGAGTMTELTDASGDIDTSDQLNMFSLYGHVFIVNGENKKVADFINTKITTADVVPADKVLPLHGDTLTGGTSGAIMIVDFVDASDGACSLYGYRTTDETFESGEVVTGTNDDGDVSFTLNADETAPPHWYDWTVYAADTDAYGTIPDKLYLGCGYRGRATVSGNPEDPTQWYMSRQANPWDFNISASATDAQRAYIGGLGDAGKVQDVIRSLMSCNDDYLVFGGANSVSCLSGDPAAGGSIVVLDPNVGVYGAQSWCFGRVTASVGEGNTLYYFSSSGEIYRTAVPGVPESLSSTALPNLMADEAVDPSVHRITMACDSRQHGIMIYITKLSDGTNSNYWFDLTTQGFFPELLQSTHGAYSLCEYAANDPDLAGVLVGCKDGYIRVFNPAEKSDDGSAIDSYVIFGPFAATPEDMQYVLSGLRVVAAGGTSGGSQTDSNNITYRLYTADTAEEVMEKIESGAAPAIGGTIAAPGYQRGGKDIRRVRGAYFAIYLGNATSDQTWALEQLLFNLKKAGRV